METEEKTKHCPECYAELGPKHYGKYCAMCEVKVNARAVAKQLGEAVNIMGGEKDFVEEFVKTLRKDHRTLQAGVIRTLLNAFIKYGKDCEKDRDWDGRNEAAVQHCLTLERPHIPVI